MKKFISIVILISIIIAAVSYSFLYVFLNLRPPENTVNKTFRKHILPFPLLRKALRLEQVGDARYDYMKNASSRIVIHLYYQEGEQLEDETLQKVLNEIFRITLKAQKIIISEPTILKNIPDRVSNKQINILLDNHKYTAPLFSPEVPLNIFVLNEYELYPSYAGLVVEANSLILFKKIIRDVSEYQTSAVPAEVSTILHEFAHLAGAEHISNEDCIMAEKIENINLFNRPSSFRDRYCYEDIQAIQENF